METTPYGTRETSEGFEVWQEWWGRQVGGPFATREEAEQDAIAAKREERRKLADAATFYAGKKFDRKNDPAMRGDDGL